MHPVTLVAVAVLLLNDWVLKRAWRDGPLHAIAGKLSDIAGLAFAPVVLTAAIGLALAIAATAFGFAAVKLSPAAAEAVVSALSYLGRPASIYLDRTDLLCLPALAVAYWIGRDELRRVPLGKPAALHRLGRPAEPALADTRWARADTRELAAAIDAWDVPKIDALLR